MASIHQAIVNAPASKPVPVYGEDLKVRDWLYVADHCAALRTILAKGRVVEAYNLGGNAEIGSVEVVRTVWRVLEELVPGRDFSRLISFVQDRPGHDRRYANDATWRGLTPARTSRRSRRRSSSRPSNAATLAPAPTWKRHEKRAELAVTAVNRRLTRATGSSTLSLVRLK